MDRNESPSSVTTQNSGTTRLYLPPRRAEAKLQYEDGTIPLIVFIGDGVSDLPAARQADVLFARRVLRLEEYCVENQIPYIAFDTFADI